MRLTASAGRDVLNVLTRFTAQHVLMCFAVGYTMDTMYFTWLDNPVDVDDALQLPQFFLVKTPQYDCSQNYTAGRSVASRVSAPYNTFS